MTTIRELMAQDHRHCDDLFVAVEGAVADGAWDNAATAFSNFRVTMLRHFAVEETMLFTAFEARTGMRMGPTQVMRGEHTQMRELLDAAQEALAEHDAENYSGYAETLLIMVQQHNMKEENVLYPMCDQHLAHQHETLVPQLNGKINPVE